MQTTMNQKKSNRFTPLLMALCIIIGIIIGTFYANHFSGNRLNIINSGSNRLSNLLHIISDQYVDEVNIDSLVDVAIPQILSELDPHSVYINSKQAQTATDDLKVRSQVSVSSLSSDRTLFTSKVSSRTAPPKRPAFWLATRL